MNKPLRVLIVEDSEDDALLAIRELERGGYDTTFERVETAKAMADALENQAWDIIIADYRLPHFSGPEALKLFQQYGLDLPFIVVSGAIGEDIAIITMKEGAHDYLMKGNLKRLVPAVERELSEAEVRKGRKQAEEALLESEEKFRTIANQNMMGIGILQDNVIKYINKAMVDIYGYTVEEVLDWKPMEFFKIFTPETLEIAKEQAEKKQAGDPSQLVYYLVHGIHKTGKLLWADNFSRTISYQGRPADLITQVDITERKQAEDNLKQEKEFTDTALDAQLDTFFLFEPATGKTIRWNRAFREITGYTDEEIAKKPAPDSYYSPEDLKRATVFIQKVLVGGAGTIELDLICKDGRKVPTEYQVAAIRDEKGEPKYLISIGRDITNRKKMEEQLLTNDRLASIGELVSGVAHELNNPLTSIIGFSDLLVVRKDFPDDIKEDLKIINREAQRTANIVKNLLTFARKQPKEKQATDLNKAIQAVLELRAYEQKVSNLQVNTRFTPDLPEITANSSGLQQVFLNIIVNAEHAMLEAHGKGTITITTERDGDIIRASLADDGPGISKENLGHIFDPFFTTKEAGKGTGLGLSICYGTITEHGGKIYAESELGKGTTFIIELPVSTTDNEGTTSENS